MAREELRPKKQDAGRSMSKLKASVSRVILAERVVSAFKTVAKLEEDEEEPKVKVGKKELLKRVVTAQRWMFMDARKDLIRHKEEEQPKNPRELLKLVFLSIRRAIRRQELKRRVVTVFWVALENKKPVVPGKWTESPPELEKTTSVTPGKLTSIREARTWITEPVSQWQQSEEQQACIQNHMARMKVLSESGQSQLGNLSNLKHQIESNLMSAKAIQESMAPLMKKPWLVEHPTQTHDKLQDELLKGEHTEKNEERCEGETKHGNVEEENKEADGLRALEGEHTEQNEEKGEAETKRGNAGEENEEAQVEASSCLLDVGCNCGDSICLSEAARSDPVSCRGQQQPAQWPTNHGSKPEKANKQESLKLAAPEMSHCDKLGVVHTTMNASQTTSKNFIITEPVVEADCNEDFRKKCSLGDSSTGPDDGLSPSDEHNAPAIIPAAEQSWEPLIVVTQPDDLSHDSVEVAEPTFLAQPQKESDEQQLQTTEPTVVLVQHGDPAITIMAEQSESVAVPSCLSPVERQTSKSGARQLSKRSSTSCLEVPSSGKCGSHRSMSRSSSKTALAPMVSPASALLSSSKTASGHTLEVPRRRSSSKAISSTAEAPRRSSSKMVPSNAEEAPQRSVIMTAPRRFSSKNSPSCNEVDAVGSPENRPSSLTEVMRHGGKGFSASHTSVRQLDKQGAFPSVVGARPNSPCANRPALSNSAFLSREEEPPLHCMASEPRRPMSSGGEALLGSVEDDSLPEIVAASRSSSKRRPEALAIVSAPSLSQAFGIGGQPARDRSATPALRPMGKLRRSCSKQSSHSAAGLEATGCGRAGSKNSAEKKATCSNSVLSANRWRRASSLTIPRSSTRLVPDKDVSGLLVTGKS